MEKNINSENVKTCWNKIKQARGSDYFVDKFYQALFEQYPETRDLFPESMKAQNIALISMLDNVINGIEYLDQLTENLAQLGSRHQNMGITTDMYDVLTKIIVATAQDASDESLTEEEVKDWEYAFKNISTEMIKGYSE